MTCHICIHYLSSTLSELIAGKNVLPKIPQFNPLKLRHCRCLETVQIQMMSTSLFINHTAPICCRFAELVVVVVVVSGNYVSYVFGKRHLLWCIQLGFV